MNKCTCSSSSASLWRLWSYRATFVSAHHFIYLSLYPAIPSECGSACVRSLIWLAPTMPKEYWAKNAAESGFLRRAGMRRSTSESKETLDSRELAEPQGPFQSNHFIKGICKGTHTAVAYETFDVFCKCRTQKLLVVMWVSLADKLTLVSFGWPAGTRGSKSGVEWVRVECG